MVLAKVLETQKAVLGDKIPCHDHRHRKPSRDVVPAGASDEAEQLQVEVRELQKAVLDSSTLILSGPRHTCR